MLSVESDRTTSPVLAVSTPHQESTISNKAINSTNRRWRVITARSQGKLSIQIFFSIFIITLFTTTYSLSRVIYVKIVTAVYLINRKKSLKQTLIVLLIVVLNFTFIPPVLAADTANGAKIFEVNCAGCHLNGGNIVRRGKNLKQKALKKYGMDSIDAIANIVTNGKNNMSAYKDRLNEQEILDVSVYVLEQAQKDWR